MIIELKFHVGQLHGLEDPTALLTLPVAGRFDRLAVERLLARVRTYFEQTDGIPVQGMPRALLVGEYPVDSPDVRAAEVLAALCVGFQRLARDPVGPAQVLSVREGTWALALPYLRREVLQSGVPLFLRLFQIWSRPAVDPEDQGKLHATSVQWLRGVHRSGMAPNTLRFALAARAKGHPVASMGNGLVQIGWGALQQRMESSFTGDTSVIATRIAKNKPMASAIMARAGLPVPRAVLVENWAQALRAAQALEWPVVVKPANLDQGQGVVPDIRSEPMLREAYERAASLSPRQVLVEKHVEGADHRMLVVGGRLLAASRREPGGVVGDGRSTVMQLLDVLNADPRRGSDQRSLLKRVDLDEEAKTRLSEQGLAEDSVVERGRFVVLRRTANISTGGTAVDVTSHVHPDNRRLVERAARVVGLDIAGIDLLCPDLSKSWQEVGGAICEVNAQPGFRPHWLGDPGRDVNAEIVDWMCRAGSRIPTAAITGTNGKSTTARMLHHIWLAAGRYAGASTSSGVWLGPDRMLKNAPVGVSGARMVLDDPAVEAAVLELPRRGLIRLGQPCDHYDVAALLNVQDDHLGVDGIDSLEAMANLKAQVIERASKAVVVNADEELCLSVLGRAKARRRLLVSRHGDANPAVKKHLEGGGEAVLMAEHKGAAWIILASGEQRQPLLPLDAIPATMNGLLRFNQSNAMFAVALAWAQGIPMATVRAALGTFSNTYEDNPGRYNLIEGFPFTVLLDYGHNPDGIREICSVASRWPTKGRRLLVSTNIGNRHRRHIHEVAGDVAASFSHVVISNHSWYVHEKSDWEAPDPAAQHLAEFEGALRAAGLDSSCMTTFADRMEAVRHGLRCANAGDLLVVLADEDARAVVQKELHERETSASLAEARA